MTVELRGVSVSYGGRDAVTDVHLTIESGEVVGLLGPNGSGKSSLVRAIAGLVAHKGEVLLDGVVMRVPGHRRSSQVAYMPQDISTRAALTALEVVLLGRLETLGFQVREGDMQAALAMLDELGIADLADRSITELSGGQRQLTFLAQILVKKPSVLLLDEPISALDISHQLHVLEKVQSLTRARGLACVLVLHDLNAAARFADKVVILKKGRLLGCGQPPSMLTEAGIGEAFHVEAMVQQGRDGKPTITPLHATEMGRI